MKIVVLVFDLGTINQRDVELPANLTLTSLRQSLSQTFENSGLTTAKLSIVCINGAERVDVKSDADLKHIQATSSLDITVGGNALDDDDQEDNGAQPLRKITVSSTREGDFFASPHSGVASLPLTRNGLLDKLKQYVITSHELENHATINLSATTVEGVVALTSDAIVENLLEDLSAGAVLQVSFCPVASVPLKRVPLHITLTATGSDAPRVQEVEFAFQAGSAVLASLKQECVHVFDLPQESQLQLSIVADGATQPVPSDRALEEAFLYLLDEHPNDSVQVVAFRVVSAKATVEAKSDDKTVQFVFEYEVGQDRLLDGLKDACRRHLQLDVAASIALVDSHGASIGSNNDVAHALEAAAKGHALQLTVRRVADTVIVPVECTKDLSTVKFPFSFAIEGTMLVRSLREECGVRLHELVRDDEVLSVLDEHDSEAPLSSDAVLRDVITHVVAAKQPLRILIKQSTSSAASNIRRKIACTLQDETAEFEFTFSLIHANLLSELLRECKAELDLLPSEEIVLEAVVEDGVTMPLRSDREVRELLVELSPTEALALVARVNQATHSAAAERAINLSKRVQCQYKGEVAEFDLQFTIDQDGLLDHLAAEAKDELDLMPNEHIILRLVTEDDTDLIVDTDAKLRDILATVAEPVPFSVILRSKKKSIVMVRRSVNVTLHGETASFDLNFALSEDGLLSFLHGECLDELDLLPNEKLQLTFVGDSKAEDCDAVLVSTDAILRQILAEVPSGETLCFEATVVEKPRTKVTRPVQCTLKDETAEFQFQYAFDDANLLQNLVDECKEELDLLPTEHISLQVDIDDDKVPLRGDRDLRELLSQLEPNSILKLIATEVSASAAGSPLKAVAALSQTVTFHVRYQEETRTLTFRFRSGENSDGSLLRELSEDVRAVLDLGDGPIKLFHGASKPELLQSDETVRTLSKQSAAIDLHVELAAPSTPPNRKAELNALHFDWLDVLNEPDFDASDIRLVVSNVRINGATLPSTDALCVKVSQFASEEQPRSIREDFLPFLESLMDHLDDEAASKMCHVMRDVLDFLVDRSPNFRLKRVLSNFFRHHAVGGVVASESLQSLLASFGAFDGEDLQKVFAGVAPSLNQVDYNEVMEQLFRGDLPELAEFVMFTESNQKESEGRQSEANAVRRLRNIRIAGDLRHAFDGVIPLMMVEFAKQLDEESLKELVTAVSALAGGPSSTADALAWFSNKCQDETKAAVFMSELMNQKQCPLELEALAKVCTTLIHPSLDPSLMLSISPAANALSVWGLSVSKLACQQARCGFPPVLQHNPRPPSARSAGGRARGFSSPMALRTDTTATSVSETREVAPKLKYEPKYSHLSNDLKTTAAQPSDVTLRSLTIEVPPQEKEVAQIEAPPTAAADKPVIAPSPPPKKQQQTPAVASADAEDAEVSLSAEEL